ncbi:ATP-binding protein [Halomonas chromatireducens]|uniref:Ferredoxin n=1 Tax=Halomonas chromatireducens TaxID=507626 RepID=A0A120JWB1_9GAMM|nr:ferredoxin [Halomonas chromatireducens]
MPQTPSPSYSTPKPLRPSLPGIGWLKFRCLQAPPHPLACASCIDACPSEALAFHENGDGVSLLASDACHGCAHCVPACPTEALVSAEIDALVAVQAEGEPLRLGCHRASNETGLRQLHCLRSLGPDQIAWLRVRAMPAQLELHLPDACKGCLAAPLPGHDKWFEQADLLCRVFTSSASADYQSPSHPVSRRALLVGRATPQLPMIDADDSAPKARRLQRYMAVGPQLDDLASPPLPGLTLDQDACQGHGVCARVCPTTALQETPSGELIFNAMDCLDCGHCLTACPEDALQVVEAWQPVPVTLRQIEQANCFECGRPFTRKNHASAKTCPACRREKALMQESFQDLFG